MDQRVDRLSTNISSFGKDSADATSGDPASIKPNQMMRNARLNIKQELRWMI